MNSTLLARPATPWMTGGALGGSTAGCIAMERQSVTAPVYRAAHGTGLPFAGYDAAVLTIAANDALKARTAVQTDVPGSPPRGGPV